MGHSRPLFLYFHLFNTVYLIQLIVNKIGDGWIETTDLRCWKQLLCQLSHNHYPILDTI